MLRSILGALVASSIVLAAGAAQATSPSCNRGVDVYNLRWLPPSHIVTVGVGGKVLFYHHPEQSGNLTIRTAPAPNAAPTAGSVLAPTKFHFAGHILVDAAFVSTAEGTEQVIITYGTVAPGAAAKTEKVLVNVHGISPCMPLP